MSRSLGSDKKGDISSIILFIVIIFFLSVSGLFIHYITGMMVGTIKNTTASMTDRPEVNATLDTAETKVTSMFDYLIMALFAGIFISMILLSYSVGASPIMFPLFIILWIISIVISAPISNTWITISTNSSLNSSASSMPITNNLLSYLPIYITIIGLIIIIVLYAKRRDMINDFGQ